VTINKKFGKGRKVKKSKTAATLVSVAINKVGKARAIGAKNSVVEVYQTLSATERGGAK